MELPTFEIKLNPEYMETYSKVSIVKDPAIELELIKFNKDVPLFFANDEKRVIYCVAMRPNKLIFRNDVDGKPANVFYTPETIEQFQQMYFKNNHNKHTNVNHSEQNTKGIYAFESWIVKDPNIDKSKAIGLETMAGDLVMAFKIDNDEVWQQCKSGDLNGLSIEGYFKNEKVNNFKPTIMRKSNKAYKFFKELFADEDESEVIAELEKENEELEAKVEELEAKLDEEEPTEMEDEDLATENADLKAKVAELEAKIAELEAEKVQEDADLETMNKELRAMKAEFTKFKRETGAARAVKNVPSFMSKDPSQMTNFEKLKFNRNGGR